MYQVFGPLFLAGALFMSNPETGQIVQTETGVVNPSGNLFQEETGEESAAVGSIDENVVVAVDTGDVLSDPLETPENLEILAGDSSGSGDLPVSSGSDSELLALVEESVELLAESSASVNGTLNSQVLDLMDRIVNGLPDGFKYAGFRTGSDDSYEAVLYLSRDAETNGTSIVFGDDCYAVEFQRNEGIYTNYLYYTKSSSPGAVVTVSDGAIVYTNVIDYSPSLGESEFRGVVMSELLALLFFFGVLMYVLNRRRAVA